MRTDIENATQDAIIEKQRLNTEIAQQIIGGFTSYFQTSKEAELEAAGDSEAKKKEITKRYANIEMAIKIAQTLANLYMGIADIWAKFGSNPVAATILSALMVGNATAQIGLASAQQSKIKGYKQGLYPVQDHNGQSYNAAMGGSPSTQMVSKPTVFLAGEQGRNFPEMIIDGPTFKRLQINYPEAITAINRSRTPGFAAGNYPAQTAAPAAPAIPAEFYAVIMELNNTLKKGINANVGWNQLKDKEYTANLIEKTFGTLPDKLN
jgi:tubulin-specific chaperone A